MFQCVLPSELSMMLGMFSINRVQYGTHLPHVWLLCSYKELNFY